jgi:hypothetical protein
MFRPNKYSVLNECNRMLKYIILLHRLTFFFLQILASALLIAASCPNVKAGFHHVNRPGGGSITGGNANTYAFFGSPVSAPTHPAITSSATGGGSAGGYAGFLSTIFRADTAGQGATKGVVRSGGHGRPSNDYDVSKLF